MPTVSTRLNNLQALRAVAALMVVFAHVDLPRYRPAGIRPDMFNFGSFGVDIFFVISGFIMMYVSTGKAGLVEAGKFFQRRVLRVWPLYAFFTGVAVYLAFKSNPNWWLQYNYPIEKTGAKWIIESLTFTHWNRNPVYAIGWTLIYEFWFYVAVAVMIALGNKPKIFFLSYTLVIFSARLLGFASNPVLNFFTHPLMLEFVFGVILHELYAAGKLKYSHRKAIILLMTVVASSYFAFQHINSPRTYDRLFFCGFAAFCIVALALTFEPRFSAGKVLIWMGDSSYSLYLVHWVVVTTLPSLLDIYHLAEIGVVAFVALNVTVSLCASWVIFLLVERPLRLAAQSIRRFTSI